MAHQISEWSYVFGGATLLAMSDNFTAWKQQKDHNRFVGYRDRAVSTGTVYIYTFTYVYIYIYICV